MSKAQINKWLWDLKNRQFKNEKIAQRQCGLLFEIYNTKTRKDITPSFLKKFSGEKQNSAVILFKIEK